MYTKWAELGKNASNTAHIVNLIWTELMANARVGSNSMAKEGSARSSFVMPASGYTQIALYDWRYGSVAIAFARVYLMLVLLTILLYAIKAGNIKSLLFLLNQTAAGRSMTTERFEASSEVDLATTKHWAVVRSGEMVRIGKETVGSREPSLKVSSRQD